MTTEGLYTHYKNLSYDWRARYFAPILKILASLKITPNQITYFRLIFALPLAYFFLTYNLLGIFITYSLFWIVDLFDGSLARYLNMTTDKGRFIDTILDNFMYAFLIVGFIYLKSAIAYILAYNILAELSVQLLSIVKKQRTTPSDFIIRAEANTPYFKTAAHAALAFYVFGINLLNPVFIILDLLLTITALYYFLSIQKKA